MLTFAFETGFTNMQFLGWPPTLPRQVTLRSLA